ncbi:MAG: NUDIX hydrolase [Actinomycetota bacterium]
MSGFRHLGDQLVHQGYIWHVAVGTFESPDGDEFKRDIVRSPGAVAAVPLQFDDAGVAWVTLVRQYRSPFDEYVLEIPAGMRDIADEPVEATAARELVEEVGLRAGALTFLSEYYPAAGMTDSRLWLYLATELVEVDRDTHGPEEAHMEVVRMPLAQAVEMVMRGEIHDGKTIIGLLMVDRGVREGSFG